MKLPTFLELKRGGAYVLLNFATPLVFYSVFHVFGAKPAIGFSVAVTLIQFAIHRFYQIKISPFFILASGFIVCFGVIDGRDSICFFLHGRVIADNFSFRKTLLEIAYECIVSISKHDRAEAFLCCGNEHQA